MRERGAAIIQRPLCARLCVCMCVERIALASSELRRLLEMSRDISRAVCEGEVDLFVDFVLIAW